MPTTRDSELRARQRQHRPAFLPASPRPHVRAAPALSVARVPSDHFAFSLAGALVRAEPLARTPRVAPRPPAVAQPRRRQVARTAPRPPSAPGRAKTFCQRLLAALHLRADSAPSPAARAAPAPTPDAETAQILQLVALPSARIGSPNTVGVHVTTGARRLRIDMDGDAVDVGGLDRKQLFGHAPHGTALLARLRALNGGAQVAWKKLEFLGVYAAALTQATCPISLHELDEMQLPVAVRCEQVWHLFDLPALCDYLAIERAAGRRPTNPLNRRSFELLRDVRCVVRLDG